MHCSQKTFHFLSVFKDPTSNLSSILVISRKSHEIIFVGYFWKITNTCKRCFWDVSEMSRNRHLVWDMFETSFLMFLRRLKDVTKKTSFLRCLWDVLKTSQKSCPFWLFVWLCTWFRVIWALFPKVALMHKYPKNRYNSIIRWSWQKSKTSFEVKCGAEDYGLL